MAIGQSLIVVATHQAGW